MWVAWWAGCGPGTAGVDWDATTSSDAGEDVLVGVFLLGTNETDGALLRAVHPVGSTLRIRALPRAGQGRASSWSARSLDEDVVLVRQQEASSSALELRLAFAAEGDTELAVIDGAGTVLDTEQLVVREAVGADVSSWEDARRGEARPLDVLHVVEGTSATFVVMWRTSDGAPMSGGDVLAVDGPASLAPEAGFDGVNEILRVSPGEGTRGTHVLTLSAVDREVRTVDVVVHGRDEVDEVALELGPARVSSRTGGFVDGTVFSVVRAGDEVMNGAEVSFTWPGGQGEGDTLDFAASAGPETEVEACFDEVCNTFPLPAGVVAVRDEEADLSDGGSCGCAQGGGAPVGWAVAGLLAVARRRRR